MSTIRQRAEEIGKRYVGEWDGDEKDVFATLVADIEQLAEYARQDGRDHERCIVGAARAGANKERRRHAKLADELIKMLQRYNSLEVGE